MKIAIDIDDTLNVIERARYAAAYLEKEGLPFRVTDPCANAFVRVCDWSEEDVIRFIGAGGAAAFIEALPREGAQKTLSRWKEAGHTIVILTARLKSWFGDPPSTSSSPTAKRRGSTARSTRSTCSSTTTSPTAARQESTA